MSKKINLLQLANLQAALFIILLPAAASGQLMDNNCAADRADKKIKTETGYYLHPQNDNNWPDSLCLTWVKEFDVNGKLVRFTDYWRCGQPYSYYEYEYNDKGECNKSWVSYQSNRFSE